MLLGYLLASLALVYQYNITVDEVVKAEKSLFGSGFRPTWTIYVPPKFML